jgi:hypothetical protein
MKSAAKAGLVTAAAGAVSDIKEGTDSKLLTAVADASLSAGVNAASAGIDGKGAADIAVSAASSAVSTVGGHIDRVVQVEDGVKTRDSMVSNKYLGAVLKTGLAAGSAAISGGSIAGAAIGAVRDTSLFDEQSAKFDAQNDQLAKGGFLTSVLDKVQAIAANKVVRGVIVGTVAAAVTIGAVYVVSKILETIPTEQEIAQLKEGTVEGEVVVNWVNLPGHGGSGGCGSGCRGQDGYILLERLDD